MYASFKIHQKGNILKKKENAVLEWESSDTVSFCSCQHFGQFFRFSAMFLLHTLYRAFQEAFELLSSALGKKKKTTQVHLLNAGAWSKEGEHTWCRLVRKLMLSALLLVFCSYSPIPHKLLAPYILTWVSSISYTKMPFKKVSLLTWKNPVRQISMLAQVKGITFQANHQNIFASCLYQIAFKRSY